MGVGVGLEIDVENGIVLNILHHFVVETGGVVVQQMPDCEVDVFEFCHQVNIRQTVAQIAVQTFNVDVALAIPLFRNFQQFLNVVLSPVRLLARSDR